MTDKKECAECKAKDTEIAALKNEISQLSGMVEQSRILGEKTAKEKKYYQDKLASMAEVK